MRILIVEDEHRIAQAIKKGLEQETFSVDTAFNGNDGYDLACVEDYGLIILDLLLPGMDGIKICGKLRAKNIQTPILMLTAKSSVTDRVKGLNSGADDYLVKPFAFEELLARVRALIRRPANKLGEILKLNDLSLNTLTYEVKRANTAISLTKKEYALLEYLMRNAGRIISKDRIISQVWDYDADILPNNVEVYIGYLRNKIDKPFESSSPLVHTVRGFGYRLGESK
jgi:two-component system, OmpR family, response regulator